MKINGPGFFWVISFLYISKVLMRVRNLITTTMTDLQNTQLSEIENELLILKDNIDDNLYEGQYNEVRENLETVEEILDIPAEFDIDEEIEYLTEAIKYLQQFAK